MKLELYEKITFYTKKLSDKELVFGRGGNISVKEEEKMHITSSGSEFSNIDEDKISTIDLSTGKIFDDKIEPSCEWRMHLQCYKNRPDIKCVVHTHPIFSTVVGICSEEKVSASYELVTSFKTSNITKIKYLPPGSKKLAEEVGRRVNEFEGMILAGHGIVTVGNSIKEAVDRSIVLERESKRWICEKILKKLHLVDKKMYSSLENLIKI